MFRHANGSELCWGEMEPLAMDGLFAEFGQLDYGVAGKMMEVVAEYFRKEGTFKRLMIGGLKICT